MSSSFKLPKARSSNLAKLEAYELTDSTTRNVLQATVKDLSKKEYYVNSNMQLYSWDYLKDNELGKLEKKLKALENIRVLKNSGSYCAGK